MEIDPAAISEILTLSIEDLSDEKLDIYIESLRNDRLLFLESEKQQKRPTKTIADKAANAALAKKLSIADLFGERPEGRNVK